MSLFDNKYPYTDFHELNLDWLLEHYKDLIESLDEINTWISEHKIEYDEAIEELNRLSGEIDGFEAQINAQFELLKAQQQQQLDNAINAMNNNIDYKIRQLKLEVETAIQDMNELYDTLRVQLVNELTQFRIQINREIASLRGLITANNDYVFEWVENRIEAFIESLPEIFTVMVYNPYRGEITDIQTAINDLYNMCCIFGLTAQQYDDLGLTASEYDAMELTASEYDAWGYKLLNYPDPNYYMMSPFTGELTPVKDVVLRLAYFHMEGLTATEYDAKELTASEYDALNITAFDYDWFGEQLIA